MTTHSDSPIKITPMPSDRFTGESLFSASCGIFSAIISQDKLWNVWHAQITWFDGLIHDPEDTYVTETTLAKVRKELEAILMDYC